jgi:hypothetical protein
MEAGMLIAQLALGSGGRHRLAVGVSDVQAVDVLVLRDSALLEVAVHAVRDRVGVFGDVWETRHVSSEPS